MIKLKFWDKKNKRFTKIPETYPISNLTYPDFLNQFDVLQYTGLKDCNGVEICERDICKEYCSYGNKGFHKGIIKFKEGCFIFERLNQTGSILKHCINENFKVIGNIYENPELLEAK